MNSTWVRHAKTKADSRYTRKILIANKMPPHTKVVHTNPGRNIQRALLILCAGIMRPTFAFVSTEGVADTSFQVTEDFIFESQSRQDLIYNPEFVEIVKRIDLSPLVQITEVLSDLMDQYNRTCDHFDEIRQNISKAKHFVHIPAHQATLMEAVDTCRGLGMKLLELRTNQDVSNFLSEVKKEITTSPAAVFYDERTRSFSFFSDQQSIKDNTVVLWTPYGHHISSYDRYDSYSTYFGRYILKGAQIYMDFAAADSTYDHFYCQEGPDPPAPNVESCRTNLQFVTDIANTNIGYIDQLRGTLKQGIRGNNLDGLNEESRNKRASSIMAGFMGGVFGAISSQLFSEITPKENLASASKETDRILDTLQQRTNALDVNQRRMSILIDRIEVQLNNDLSKTAYQVDLASIHLRINSILIHLGDHLTFLYQLLKGDETDPNTDLVLSEDERTKILQEKMNGSRDVQIAKSALIRHRFQMLAETTLCIIMEIPLKPSITSIAALKVHPFPAIDEGLLTSPQIYSRHFLQFSGGFYVQMDGVTFQRCLEQNFCSGSTPLQYADSTSGCDITQFYGEEGPACTRTATSNGRFLFYTGESIIHAVIDPITLRVQCDGQNSGNIRRLQGRGITHVPMGCHAHTNKAIFPRPQQRKILMERNYTIGKPIKIIQMKPTTRKTKTQNLDLLKLPQPHIADIGKETGSQCLLIILLFCVAGASLLISILVLTCSPVRNMVTRV